MLNVLSVLSWLHPAGSESYSAAKATALVCAHAVREELATRGISVSELALSPGTVGAYHELVHPIWFRGGESAGCASAAEPLPELAGLVRGGRTAA